MASSRSPAAIKATTGQGNCFFLGTCIRGASCGPLSGGDCGLVAIFTSLLFHWSQALFTDDDLQRGFVAASRYIVKKVAAGLLEAHCPMAICVPTGIVPSCWKFLT